MKNIIEIKIDDLESELNEYRNKRDSYMSQGKLKDAQYYSILMDQLRFTIKEFKSLL
jgi:hypothetical protein